MTGFEKAVRLAGKSNLAKICGISAAAVTQWGDRWPRSEYGPQPKYIDKISRAVCMSREELLKI